MKVLKMKFFIVPLFLLFSCDYNKDSNFFKIITSENNVWVFIPDANKSIEKFELNAKYKFKNDFTYEDVGILKGTRLGNGKWNFDRKRNEVNVNSQIYKVSFFSNDSIILHNKTTTAKFINIKILKNN